VELVPLNNSDATLRAVEEAVILHDEHGGVHRVRVQIGKQKGFYLGRGPQVQVTAHCPTGTNLSVSSAAAMVRAEGRYGDVEIKAVSGDTDVTEADGEARLKAVSGDMRIGRVGGRAELGSVSGDVRIDAVGGPCTVKTVSGDVMVGDAQTSVDVTTVSGDQQLSAVQSGRVELRSVSGDIRIGVRRGTGVFMDVNSRSGELSSELDAADGEGEGGGAGGTQVEIRASSVSGDIALVRAAGREPAVDHAA
jgi:DUF4097 and DUF4098 domain-containing protein YvlB